MPTYEYKCSKCGSVQELERSIHAEGDNPFCCDTLMSRVWGAVPVKFNGTGFYTTDNPKR